MSTCIIASPKETYLGQKMCIEVVLDTPKRKSDGRTALSPSSTPWGRPRRTAPSSASGIAQPGCSFTELVASATSAMIPPSPRLLARMIRMTYLSVTITISAQRTADTPPSTLPVVNAMPCAGLNTSLAAYSGLVPMSP